MERVDDLVRRVLALETRLKELESEQIAHHRENTARLATIESNQGKIAETVDKRFNTIDSLLNRIEGALWLARWVSRIAWPAILAVVGWLAHKFFAVAPTP